MASGILRITDGTIIIDLLVPISGIMLTAWAPSRPPLKRVKTSGPWGGGSRVRMYGHENVTESLTYIARSQHPDLLIQECQELDRLLLKALDYWATNWQMTPVWLEARGDCETNTRYAIITDYEGAVDGMPYREPFTTAGQSSMGEVSVSIEHMIWTDVIPIYPTAQTIDSTTAVIGTPRGHGVNIQTQQTYQEVLGREEAGTVTADVPADEHYVANKHNQANITHIYAWHAAGFSANLQTAGLPYGVGFAPVANNDLVYFGIDTALANSGPFESLIFNLSAIATYGAGCSATWQYWNGAWVALTTYDGTAALAGQPLSTLGVNSVHWAAPSNWAATAINGITAYWVRLVFTVGAGAITVATQATRDVYAVVWPRVDIVDAAEVPGDMPALGQIKVRIRSDYSISTPVVSGYVDRVMIGTRSLSRGSSYTPFINYSDEQNGAWVFVTNSAISAFGNDTTAPSGRAMTVTFPAAITAYTDVAQIRIYNGVANTLPGEWLGLYRCFVRYRGQGTGGGRANGDMNAYIVFSEAGVGTQITYTTPTKPLLIANTVNVLDFGTVRIPSGPMHMPIEQYVIYIDLFINNVVAVAQAPVIYDLILFPVDEWFGVFEANMTAASTAGRPLTASQVLDVSSLTYAKETLTSFCRWNVGETQPGQIENVFIPYAPGPCTLQANKTQRVWFFMQQCPSLYGLPRTAPFHLSASIQVLRASRYQSMRGAR